MNKSEQLIACLEGEIAKRDEELAACRVAVENCDVFRARIVELESAAESLRLSRDYHHEQEIEYRRRWAGLYAAPVSEAKAQGVVMPEREEFEDAYSAEYGTPVSVLKLLREGENYIEKPQHSDRLNSSWWMWQKARASLNAAHDQQVSVPDGWKLVPVVPTSEMISAGNDAAHAGGCDLYQLTREVMNAYPAMLSAAPAAAGVTGHD